MKENKGSGWTNGWTHTVFMWLVSVCVAIPMVAEAKVVYKWLQLVEGSQSQKESSHLAASALVWAIVDRGDMCPVLYDHRV